MLSFINQLKNKLSNDMGIDLGTANTLVYLRGTGIVVREPSVVAINENTKEIMAIGDDAYSMVGRTPGNIIAVRPLKDGVIANYEITEHMLRYFIKKAETEKRFGKPRVMIGVPWGITEVEKRAVIEAGYSAGAREVILIGEPMAAAIGADLDVTTPNGHMIVDIGGGTSEIAVISLGGIVVCQSSRVAGDEFDEAIVSHCRRNYNLLIGERMAESIKKEIGSAYPFEEEKTMPVRGRDLLNGLPKTFSISSYEIRDALSEAVSTIVDSVRLTLEKTPPELSADIMDKGIILTGGGSLLHGLDKYIARETELPVTVADDALSCVAKGTGKVLEDNLMDHIRSSISEKFKLEY